MPAISRNGKFLTKTKTQADIGGVSSVRLYEKQTGSQGASSYTVFTLSGSYVPGSNTLVVYINGQKAERVTSSPANSTQYVETNSKTITFGASLQATDIVEFAIYGSYNVSNHEWNTNTYETTLTEATDDVTLPFTPDEGMISIYIDGVRQLSEAYSISGTTVTFDEELPVGTKLLFVSPNTDDIPLTNADTLDGYHADTFVEISGRKNYIINGDFNIWQRGTSISNLTNVYNADRWRGGTATTGTVTRTSFTPGQTSVPGEPEFYMSINKTGTGDYLLLEHRVENVRSLAGQTATLSFYAKASLTTTLAMTYGQNFGSGGSTATNVSIGSFTLTTSWQKITITFNIASISGMTIGTNNYMYIRFLPGNSVSSWVGTFDLSRVQLEVGSVATKFEQRSFGEELQLCLRFYEKSYDYGTAPGSAAGGAHGIIPSTVLTRLFGTSGYDFKVTKRVTPTTVLVWSQDGSSNYVGLYNNPATKIAVTSVSETTTNRVASYIQLSSNGVSNELYEFNWTVDSEL